MSVKKTFYFNLKTWEALKEFVATKYGNTKGALSITVEQAVKEFLAREKKG